MVNVIRVTTMAQFFWMTVIPWFLDLHHGNTILFFEVRWSTIFKNR